MWAIGIIAFQILTGRHPFYKNGDDEKKYINRISTEPLVETLENACKKYGIGELA